MTVLFGFVPLLTLAAAVAGVWSLWMRRAVVAAALPAMLAGLAWSLVALPWAQDAGGCDPQAALSALAIVAAVLATLSLVVTGGTLLRLRGAMRWTTFVPVTLALLAVQVGAGVHTAGVEVMWRRSCGL